MPTKRVHPWDLEAPMEPIPSYQPKYVMLNNNNSQNLRPPPQRRNIPRYDSHHHSDGSSCCRCICCCLCFWIILIITLAGAIVFLYTYLNPKVPEYNVQNFEVRAFDPQKDFSLYTEFVVTVKAVNPNDRISIIYGEGSSVVVSYTDSVLCSGKLPAYRQPYKNTTVSNIVLTGKSEFGSGLQQALLDNKNTGKIPLLVRVRAPVSIVLDDFQLKQIVVYVNCSLVVDNLAPRKTARILSSTYNYGLGVD